MKTKGIAATAIAVATLAMATTSALGAMKVTKTTAYVNDRDVAIVVNVKGSANGLIVEISKTKSFKKPFIVLDSRLKTSSSVISKDSSYAELKGTGKNYEMEASYIRYDDWRGVVDGKWKGAKGAKSGWLNGEFTNKKSQFTLIIEPKKKIKKSDRIYVRVAAVQGKRKGKFGKPVKAKWSKNYALPLYAPLYWTTTRHY